MLIEYISHLGDDNAVVDAARVSLSKTADQYTPEQNEKLIKYLAKHKHESPFFHVIIKCRVKIPIFLARQYFKHSIGSSKNEISRRYVTNDPAFFMPTWRQAPEQSIKQGSGDEFPTIKQTEFTTKYKKFIGDAYALYKEYLNNGVCPEQARVVLPQSMYTEFIDTGSLAYWARMYKLRTDPHAQKEWLLLMNQLKGIIQKISPIAWDTLINEDQSDKVNKT